MESTKSLGIAIIFIILTAHSVSFGMPQPSAVCQTLLGITGGIGPKNNPSASELIDVMGDPEAPMTERMYEVVTDLNQLGPGDRNFIFKVVLDENGEFLTHLREDLQKNDSKAVRMVNFQHITVGLGMPFWPVAHWLDRALGLPTNSKDRAFLEGWAALGTMVVGVGVVATQNPVLNVDRYIRLALQDDRQISTDLKRLEQAIANNQKSFDQISRDYIVEKDFLKIQGIWGQDAEVIELNAEQQLLVDTEPLLQRVLGAIVSPIFRSNRTKQKVSVKVDLLTNPASRRAAIVIRTRDL